MNGFARHFRALVTPKLRNLAVAEAVCVLAGVETFSGSCDAVMHYARSRGALHMSDHDLADLEEWIAVEVLTAIDARG